MSDLTFQLKLRFYGRFIYAQRSNAGGDLDVIAVDPAANPAVKADRHNAS